MSEAALRAAGAVDGARLWRRLEVLARHGARADGGVDRPALSAAEAEAKRTLIAWGAELGLSPFTDELGNLFLRWEAGEVPAVLAGSHIDSQPTGGRYDGTYGVLAALEAVAALRAAGVAPARPVEVVAWTNEEGSRFAPGMMGSAGFAGAREVPEILARRDAEGVSVAEALAAQAALLPPIPHRPLRRPVALFLEPHIEQATVLEEHGIPIGIVTGMQGKRTFRVELRGEAAHAGTAPRARRRDALLAAARMALALEELTADPEDVVRFTIGRLDIAPNAPSVVPERASFSIDLRHPDGAVLTRLGDAIAATCAREAAPCEVTVTELSCAMPQRFDAALQAKLAESAARLGISAMPVESAAGHDARFLEPICPTAMLFIPCKDGVTHHPAESIEPGHAEAGARVLAATLAQLVMF
jgi:N-carbamoyl-L-amino-acid hydrolase